MGCVGSKPQNGQKEGELPKGQKYQDNTVAHPPANPPPASVGLNQPEAKTNNDSAHPPGEDIQGSGKPVLVQPNNTLNVPAGSPAPPSRVHISYESSNNTQVNRSIDPSGPQQSTAQPEASGLKAGNAPEAIAELSQEDSNKIPPKQGNQDDQKHKPTGEKPQGSASRIAEQTIEKEKGATHQNYQAESNPYLPIEPLTHLTPAALPAEPQKNFDGLQVPPKLVERNSVDLQIAQGLQQLDLEAEGSAVGQEQYLQFWQLKLPLTLVGLCKTE